MEEKENFTENETPEVTEASESAEAPAEEVELNDEGQPRPPVDPNNGLYTFLSLLIFAVLYFGYHYAADNIFVPYSKTLTEITAEQSELLINETGVPVPDGAGLCYARISFMTDSDLLHIRYSGLTDREEFLASASEEYSLTAEDSRVTVFRGENADLDYVYADIYTSVENGDKIIYFFEKDGTEYAEFTLSDYGKRVKGAFKEAVKTPVRTEERRY